LLAKVEMIIGRLEATIAKTDPKNSSIDRAKLSTSYITSQFSKVMDSVLDDIVQASHHLNHNAMTSQVK
jgi:hypothetical protein